MSVFAGQYVFMQLKEALNNFLWKEKRRHFIATVGMIETRPIFILGTAHGLF